MSRQDTKSMQGGSPQSAAPAGAPGVSAPALTKGDSHVGEILGGTAVMLAVAWSRRAADKRYALAAKGLGAALAVTPI